MIYFLTDFVLFTFGLVLPLLVGWAENYCDIRLESVKKDSKIGVRGPKSLGNTGLHHSYKNIFEI